MFPFIFLKMWYILVNTLSYIMEEQLEQQVTRGLGASQTTTQKNFPFATEVISLPSKGLAYPESSPLSRGEITLKLMTAKEEDILTSTNLIRKGIHLDRLLESIVVEPGVNINDLLIGDKNAILIITRMLAFGAEYDITVTDSISEEDVSIKIDLSKIKTKEIDYTILNRNNEYEFTLPKSKTAIKFKLLTHGDELAIQKDVEASEKVLKQGNEITTRFRRIITEVEGNRDLGYISNFVSNRLLAMDSKALRKHILSFTPDLDLVTDYENSAGETEALRIPFGVDFFYPAE